MGGGGDSAGLEEEMESSSEEGRRLLDVSRVVRGGTIQSEGKGAFSLARAREDYFRVSPSLARPGCSPQAAMTPSISTLRPLAGAKPPNGADPRCAWFRAFSNMSVEQRNLPPMSTAVMRDDRSPGNASTRETGTSTILNTGSAGHWNASVATLSATPTDEQPTPGVVSTRGSGVCSMGRCSRPPAPACA